MGTDGERSPKVDSSWMATKARFTVAWSPDGHSLASRPADSTVIMRQMGADKELDTNSPQVSAGQLGAITSLTVIRWVRPRRRVIGQHRACVAGADTVDDLLQDLEEDIGAF